MWYDKNHVIKLRLTVWMSKTHASAHEHLASMEMSWSHGTWSFVILRHEFLTAALLKFRSSWIGCCLVCSWSCTQNSLILTYSAVIKLVQILVKYYSNLLFHTFLIMMQYVTLPSRHIRPGFSIKILQDIFVSCLISVQWTVLWNTAI
jgi:hypothetical protein